MPFYREAHTGSAGNALEAFERAAGFVTLSNFQSTHTCPICLMVRDGRVEEDMLPAAIHVPKLSCLNTVT